MPTPSHDAASRCRHGVEAGNYCAKCGREIVTGPIVTDERKLDVLRALAGIVAGPLRRSADVSGAVDPLDDPRWKSPSAPDLIDDPNFDPKGDDELSV